MNLHDICNTLMLVLLCLHWGDIAALPARIHARLHGRAGSSCPESNHTANPNCMLIVSHEDSGSDRTNVYSFDKTNIYYIFWNLKLPLKIKATFLNKLCSKFEVDITKIEVHVRFYLHAIPIIATRWNPNSVDVFSWHKCLHFCHKFHGTLKLRSIQQCQYSKIQDLQDSKKFWL